MDLGIDAKIVLVTGAGNGIGAATVAAFAAEGARVVVADVDHAAANRTADALLTSGADAMSTLADVTDSTSVARMIKAIEQRYGAGPDILVNNAGFTIDKRIVKMADTDWSRVIDVILTGAFNCTRAVLPGMIERNWGRIINVSSRAHLGNPGQANYSAAKAGLIGFTRSMSLENGKFNVTVNAVAPGIVETDAVRNLPHFNMIKANAEKTVAIPRMGRVEDVADAILFLASERASYISGDLIHVTGGRY